MWSNGFCRGEPSTLVSPVGATPRCGFECQERPESRYPHMVWYKHHGLQAEPDRECHLRHCVRLVVYRSFFETFFRYMFVRKASPMEIFSMGQRLKFVSALSLPPCQVVSILFPFRLSLLSFVGCSWLQLSSFLNLSFKLVSLSAFGHASLSLAVD